MTFGENLQKARNTLNLTQEEVAQKILSHDKLSLVGKPITHCQTSM